MVRGGENVLWGQVTGFLTSDSMARASGGHAPVISTQVAPNINQGAHGLILFSLFYSQLSDHLGNESFSAKSFSHSGSVSVYSDKNINYY